MMLPKLGEGLRWDLYECPRRGLVLGVGLSEGYEWSFALCHPALSRVNAFEVRLKNKNKDYIVKMADILLADIFNDSVITQPKARRVQE